MNGTAKSNQSAVQTDAWADFIARQSNSQVAVTVGIASASRRPNDPRCIDMLLHQLVHASTNASVRRLAIRLDVYPSRNLGQQPDQPDAIPVAQRSPLGDWSDVTIPVPVGMKASWSLEQLPSWLPKWKAAFDLILIDLGPVHLVPSRLVGRFCEQCFLLLGPTACGSPDWLMQHVAWHDRSGSSICGTILASQQRAA